MEHLSREVLGQTIVVRDLMEKDIETLVGYWHDSDPGFLYSLGVDLAKLSSRSETRERFLSSLTQGSSASRAYFVFDSGDELLAYTNLNFRSATEACAHFHVLKRTLRVRGITYLLLPDIIRMFFSVFPLENVEMQTLPENRGIDRLLQRFGLTAQRKFLDQPDGFAKPGELNVWKITRADIIRLLTAAGTHGQTQGATSSSS
jgi:RimJ/RimL family protein N-acetyltransferase